jgi:probable HAF family extracellular repeat protein
MRRLLMAAVLVLGGGAASAGAEGSRQLNVLFIIAGQVVGISAVSGVSDHAFLYSQGTMTDLGTLGVGSSGATGINSAGEVVGGSNYPGGQSWETHAFLYRDGVMTDLGTLGGTTSYAWGINEAGDVVGVAATDYYNAISPFLYRDGTMINLGSLGGAGEAYGLNDVGQVVGFSTTTTGFHAFLWDKPGGMRDLGTLGGNYSFAYAVNNAGQVVGYSQTATSFEIRSFLYSDGTLSDLNALIPAGTGWLLQEARGINDAGQIVGTGLAPDFQQHAFLLTPDGGGARRGVDPEVVGVLAAGVETPAVVDTAHPPQALVAPWPTLPETAAPLAAGTTVRQAADAVFASGQRTHTPAPRGGLEVEGLELGPSVAPALEAPSVLPWGTRMGPG